MSDNPCGEATNNAVPTNDLMYWTSRRLGYCAYVCDVAMCDHYGALYLVKFPYLVVFCTGSMW